MVKIKICGLKSLCDVEYVNKLLPEYIGFVFVRGSKRYISPKEAKELSVQLDKRITTVGVFVNEETEDIIDFLKQGIIQAVQLHGNEDEEYISALRKYTNATIIKAFCMQHESDIRTINESSADYVLLDSGGGSGELFDWSLITKVNRPYFLAGGLNNKNVSKAISKFEPFAVDASSSLETDGYKDKHKMTAFVNAVRQRKD